MGCRSASELIDETGDRYAKMRIAFLLEECDKGVERDALGLCVYIAVRLMLGRQKHNRGWMISWKRAVVLSQRISPE